MALDLSRLAKDYTISQSMDITYLGHSSFKIKGKQKSVVTDPYNEDVGKYPRGVEADMITVSHDHPDHNQTDNVGGAKFIIDGPGEYEVGGVSVIGVPTWHDDKGGEERGHNTVYVIEIDGLRVAHLGDLGHKLSQAQLEEIGAIDILLVPVGGTYTIDAKTAAEVVNQIDPWVVIPMHYRQGNGKAAGVLTGVEDFLKEMGKPTEIKGEPKYSVSADRLPGEMQVVVLDKKA